MKRKTIKIHFDSKVYLTFFLILLAGILLLGFKISNTDNCKGVKFEISEEELIAGIPVTFKPQGENASEWEWDFGDGSKKEVTSLSFKEHTYEKPGSYLATLTINGQCAFSKDIDVKKAVNNGADKLLMPNIDAPEKVYVGQRVVFKNNSSFAKSWEWYIEEEKGVYDTKPETSYTFRKPGIYYVILIVNGDVVNKNSKRIRVLEKSPQSISNKKITEKGLQKMLEDHAKKKNTYMDFKAIVCNDTGVKVYTQKKEEGIQILDFLKKIRGKKITISGIEVEYDKNGCVDAIYLQGEKSILGIFDSEM